MNVISLIAGPRAIGGTGTLGDLEPGRSDRSHRVRRGCPGAWAGRLVVVTGSGFLLDISLAEQHDGEITLPAVLVRTAPSGFLQGTQLDALRVGRSLLTYQRTEHGRYRRSRAWTAPKAGRWLVERVLQRRGARGAVIPGLAPAIGD